MPLTLEMHNSVSSQTIRLVVDRNNLLFVFPFNSDSPEEIKIAYDRKKKFDVYCEQFVKETYEGYKGKVLDAKHPLHPNLYHTCEKDRDTFHYHFCYDKDVNFDTIYDLFKKFPDSVLSEIVSPHSLLDMLIACKNYFTELENDPRAQKIEEEYRDIKRDQFIAEKKSFRTNERTIV